MESPESSVQPPITKTCDIDIVEQGSSVQREIRNNQNVEPESSGQQVQQEIEERAEDEHEFIVRKKLKKNKMLNKSPVEEIQQEIKEKPKDGVTNDLHIELNIFTCTASEKRKEIGNENTKEPVLRITKSNAETGIISQKIVDYTESSELEDDTSYCCQQNVDCDFNTDTQNVKDPMTGGKLPADAQPSSDYEEQDIPISSKREMLEVKSTEKKTMRSYSPAMMKTDQILF